MEFLVALGTFVGGIGLFLLGMWLMTDGLALAAGDRLRSLLARWTDGRGRALLVGIAVTTAVQSSSAVTVATIGFVNAGFLTLTQAAWVIFGTNVGTTITGWFVSFVGLQFKIEVLALPLIGIGMALRVSGSRTKRGALGQALAGFGAFFLGIDVLRAAFAASATAFDLNILPTDGLLSVIAYMFLGTLLTVLTQSSSAAIVIVLAAASGGAIGLEPAMATVIGANVGTTVTAVLASIGATANARRVAAAHVVFNVVAAAVALASLSAILAALDIARSRFGFADDPAVALAFFHTTFNIIGVAIMWFAAPRIIDWLSRRFTSQEEELGRPKHLDANLATVPALALRSLALEIQRLSTMARSLVEDAIFSKPGAEQTEPSATSIGLNALARSIRQFVVDMNRATLPAETARALPSLLRATQHCSAIAGLAATVEQDASVLQIHSDPTIINKFRELTNTLKTVTSHADTTAPDFSLERTRQSMASLEAAYQLAKAEFLAAGADGTLAVERMERLIDLAGTIRRCGDHAVKAAARLAPWLEATASHENA